MKEVSGEYKSISKPKAYERVINRRFVLILLIFGIANNSDR
jgi:hypothetical protein